MSADRSEKLRVAISQMECAVAAHGNTRNGAMTSTRRHAVVPFDEREKLLKQEIFVALFAIPRIYVEAGAAIGRGNQKLLQFTLFAHVFRQIPRAGMNEELLIIAKAVQEIEDGEMSRLIRVKRGRKDDAVRNRAGEDFARNRVALDSSGSPERPSWKVKEAKKKRCASYLPGEESIHSGAHQRD